MVIKNIFGMDVYGDIDEFYEELTEYEPQLLKDEVILKKRTEGNTRN